MGKPVAKGTLWALGTKQKQGEGGNGHLDFGLVQPTCHLPLGRKYPIHISLPLPCDPQSWQQVLYTCLRDLESTSCVQNGGEVESEAGSNDF